MYGYWRRPNNEPTQFGQAMQQSALYDPTTAAVARTYVEEATVGVGTGYADIQALNVKLAEESGIKISEEEYKNNPELYSEGVSWYEGMTKESARISKEFNDSARKRAQILQDASTGQAIVGFTAGFGAGVVEPKNLAIGVGASLALPGLGTAGYLGNRARQLYRLRKTASLANKVKIGAVEGVAAGIAVEPSNRYSAKTLQQDYTLADSAFNVFTSTAFGAGLPAGVHVAGKAGPFMQAKIDKFRGRAMDVATAELDLATTQLHTGQRVDVSAVEAHEIGKLADKPIAEQVRAVESINGTEPLPKISTFEDVAKIESIAKDVISEAKAAAPIEQQQWQSGLSPATQRHLENPASYVVRDKETGKTVVEIQSKQVADKVNTAKYDVVPIIEHLANLNGQTYTRIATGIETKVRQAAFGDKSLPEIVGKLDEQNAATLQKANAAALDYRNDPLIDYDTIDALDERRAIQTAEADAEAEIYYQQAEAEIRAMLDQEILNEADIAEYRAAIEELNNSGTVDALETLKLCLTRG